MNINKMSKDELELLSNKDITYYLLEDANKSINTADLFKKIIKLLELPESSFDEKIGDYYTSLATDKRFIMLEKGFWDLKINHKTKLIIDEEDAEEEIIEPSEEAEETYNEEVEEEINYDEEILDDDETEDDLKDLVIMDENEESEIA